MDRERVQTGSRKRRGTRRVGKRVRKGGTGRSRVGRPCSLHPEEGIQLKWPNPLSREYLAFGILYLSSRSLIQFSHQVLSQNCKEFRAIFYHLVLLDVAIMSKRDISL